MRVAGPLVLVGFLGGAPLLAQSPPDLARFGATCGSAPAGVDQHCFRLAEAARILGPRAVILLGGGNPVPGSASTLGMRLPGQPRFSLSGRVSLGGVELPGLHRSEPAGELAFNAPALALDLGAGLFGGFTLGPTIGGFGSVDLVASLGQIRLPERDGLSGPVTSWSAGARLGLLRESFTAPGFSASAVYRRTGDFGYGDPDLAETDAWFRLEGTSGWSLRAVIGKRLLGLGLSAGAGRDQFSADATGAVRDPAQPSGRWSLHDEELHFDRNTLFANAAYTFLILHAVAELGWQDGGDGDRTLPTTGRLRQGSLYGSLAVRLTL